LFRSVPEARRQVLEAAGDVVGDEVVRLGGRRFAARGGRRVLRGGRRAAGGGVGGLRRGRRAGLGGGLGDGRRLRAARCRPRGALLGGAGRAGRAGAGRAGVQRGADRGGGAPRQAFFGPPARAPPGPSITRRIPGPTSASSRASSSSRRCSSWL